MSVMNAAARAQARVADTSRRAATGHSGSHERAVARFVVNHGSPASAIFLLTMLATMNGSYSTVAVTSRGVELPSAGREIGPAPPSPRPSRRARAHRVGRRCAEPGIDSRLPACRRCGQAAPETMGRARRTMRPAVRGCEILSPAAARVLVGWAPSALQSKRRPESSSARVSACVSASSRPLRNAAISHALAW